MPPSFPLRCLRNTILYVLHQAIVPTTRSRATFMCGQIGTDSELLNRSLCGAPRFSEVEVQGVKREGIGSLAKPRVETGEASLTTSTQRRENITCPNLAASFVLVRGMGHCVPCPWEFTHTFNNIRHIFAFWFATNNKNKACPRAAQPSCLVQCSSPEGEVCAPFESRQSRGKTRDRVV